MKCSGCERKLDSSNARYQTVNFEIDGDNKLEIGYKTPVCDLYLENGCWKEKVFCSALCDKTKHFWRLPSHQQKQILNSILQSRKVYNVSEAAINFALKRYFENIGAE